MDRFPRTCRLKVDIPKHVSASIKFNHASELLSSTTKTVLYDAVFVSKNRVTNADISVIEEITDMFLAQQNKRFQRTVALLENELQNAMDELKAEFESINVTGDFEIEPQMMRNKRRTTSFLGDPDNIFETTYSSFSNSLPDIFSEVQSDSNPTTSIKVIEEERASRRSQSLPRQFESICGMGNDFRFEHFNTPIRSRLTGIFSNTDSHERFHSAWINKLTGPVTSPVASPVAYLPEQSSPLDLTVQKPAYRNLSADVTQSDHQTTRGRGRTSKKSRKTQRVGETRARTVCKSAAIRSSDEVENVSKSTENYAKIESKENRTQILTRSMLRSKRALSDVKNTPKSKV